jgi:dTDP-4-dehydrorhamnose 3,5-epimerase-like enzyme
VDAPYSQAGEGGIRFDDPGLAISWPHSNPLVSDRDRVLQSFSDYSNRPIF